MDGGSSGNGLDDGDIGQDAIEEERCDGVLVEIIRYPLFGTICLYV